MMNMKLRGTGALRFGVVAGLIASAAIGSAQSAVAWGGGGYESQFAGRTKINEVSVGSTHSLILNNDGTVATVGTVTGSAKPSSVVSPRSVDAGNGFSLAVLANGTVVGWGGANNNQGVSGLPTGSDFVRVVAGTLNGGALRADGTFVVWGKNNFGETTVPSGVTKLTDLAIGSDFMVGIRPNKTLVAWGRTSGTTNGQLVVNTPTSPDFVEVNAGPGGGHAVALREDGSVVAWGLNTNGQTNVPAQIASPSHPSFSRVRRVVAGSAHSVALLENGTVLAWGSNSSGQTAVPITLPELGRLYAGGATTVCLTPRVRSVVTFDPRTLVGGSPTAVTATLTLDAPATQNLTIRLTSNTAGVTVPASINIPSGQQSATFAVGHSVVASPTTASIKVNQDVREDTFLFFLRANYPISVTRASSIIAQGSSVTGTVNLVTSTPSATTVTLSASSGISVPATVTVPANETSATFTISAAAGAPLGTATVTAAAGGLSRSTSLNVVAVPSLSTITVPTIVWGNQNVIGRVSLTNASNQPTTVQLTSSDANVSVPTSITIPAGSTTGTFAIESTDYVGVDTSVTITATANGSTLNGTTSLRQNLHTAVLAATTVSSSDTTEVDATVTLRGIVKQDTVVTLSSSITGTVPASVTIPAGSRSATFKVTVNPTAVSIKKTITASRHGNSVNRVLTINP